MYNTISIPLYLNTELKEKEKFLPASIENYSTTKTIITS